MTTVHAVLPDGIDDPVRPSGGNVYDRHVCSGLASLGWSVREHAVRGFWARPDAASFAALADVVERIPDGAVVLLDGLVASTAPEVLVRGGAPVAPGRARAHAARRPPAAGLAATSGRENKRSSRPPLPSSRRAPGRGTGCSSCTRCPPTVVHVAEPGVDAAELATGTEAGGALLCVAAVTLR